MNGIDQMNQRDQKDRTDEQEAVAGMAATRHMIDGTGKFLSEGTRKGRKPVPRHCWIARPSPIFHC